MLHMLQVLNMAGPTHHTIHLMPGLYHIMQSFLLLLLHAAHHQRRRTSTPHCPARAYTARV